MPLRLIMVYDLYMTLVLADSAELVGLTYECHRTALGEEDVSLVAL